MTDFSAFDLPDALLQALEDLSFQKPTPVQEQTIPLALEGRDILGSAQTGTGKTGAFGIPLIAKLLDNPRGSALVITPTRELATQVMQALQSFLGKRSPIRTALLIGGEPMPKQFQQLRQRPRLFVGTPGRINDHLKRGTLMLHDTDFLVLDETDRMLDMGFSIQIDEILKFVSEKRQTLLFSATLPNNIIKMSKNYMTNPERVAIGNASDPAKNIKQEVMQVEDKDKYHALTEQIENREGSIIVFVRTKYATERMAQRLSKEGHQAEAIHGDLRHSKRERVIKAFRNKKYRILVATDIAARGLDIPHIEHVINHDLPQCPEDYIHRIGRTARAGAEGEAICFVSPKEMYLWKAIDYLMNPDTAEKPRAQGNKRGGGGGRRRPPRRGGGDRSGGGDRKRSSSSSSAPRGGYNRRNDGPKKENAKSAPRAGQGSERSERSESRGDASKPKRKRPFNGGKPKSQNREGGSTDNNTFRPKRPSNKRPETKRSEGGSTQPRKKRVASKKQD